jgi:dTDP-4-amino-4,6-dideoxygalactose transaminase
MIEWTVPLSDVRYSAEDVEAVAEVYRSGWLSGGARVAAFEEEFAAFAGGRHAVAVSSGTAALHLICAALGLGPGDEVVVPSLTFAATAAAVHQSGAEPVFADVRDERSPWLSADAARAAIGPRTRAIINVSYGGHPGEVLALRDLAARDGLALIEDAAHAVGARAGGLAVGTLGVAAAFSFFANKNLPLGEGGMILTADPALAARARLLRSHGITTSTWARHRGEATGYEVLEPGFNYRLDEPRAELGRRLLRSLPAQTAQRAGLAGRYRRALARIDGAEPVLIPAAGLSAAWHIYPLLLGAGVDRAAFRARLADLGVQTSVHYPALHRTSAFAGARQDLPATDRYSGRTVTVPMFPHMSPTQHDRVVAALVDALSHARALA